jgi:hypothetical protein
MPVRVKRIMGVVLVSAAMGGLWIVGPTSIAPAADGPGAHSAATVESLVRFLHPHARLAVGSRCPGARPSAPKRCVGPFLVCSADCQVSARLTLVLPGPNLGPVFASKSFPANLVFKAYIKLNRAGLALLRKYRDVARLRTRIHAVDMNTGDTDTDRHAFRFKR